MPRPGRMGLHGPGGGMARAAATGPTTARWGAWSMMAPSGLIAVPGAPGTAPRPGLRPVNARPLLTQSLDPRIPMNSCPFELVFRSRIALPRWLSPVSDIATRRVVITDYNMTPRATAGFSGNWP